MRQVSLAITHFNRFWYLLECVDQVKDDPRVGEIVISDDVSTDGSYERLQMHFKDNPKFKFFRNEQNVDCYFNKQRAVERSAFPWVILFDSDNVISPLYLDVIFEITEWDPNMLYCPDRAKPHFDYTTFAGVIVDRTNVSKLIPQSPPPPPPDEPAFRGSIARQRRERREWLRRNPPRPRPAGRPKYGTALNTCNYFVNRASYLEVWDGSIDPHTADSIFQAYNWLKAGKRILIVPGLSYFHRVHEDSHYKNNLHKTGNLAWEIEERIRQLK